MTKKSNQELNIGMVRRIMDRDPIVKVVVQHFSQMARSRTETSVDSLTQLSTDGHKLTRGQVINTLKSLELAGTGVFLAGRRGFASRFRWACDVGKMAREALAEGPRSDLPPAIQKTTPAQLANPPAVQPAPEPQAPAPAPEIVAEAPAKNETISLSTDKPLFGKTWRLSIELPVDLSPADSAKVAELVRSLGH